MMHEFISHIIFFNKVIKRQWEDLEVPSCPFEVLMHEETNSFVYSIALCVNNVETKTSGRTPRYHHYSLEHD